MGIEESLSVIADRVKNHSSVILTEEAVKTAIVLPFIGALGYDVFNPNEVVPEFTADAVGKKGERVDYAIKVGDRIRILVECKPIGVELDRTHLAQLYRYFSVTSAKFALLTNGRQFNFHTDLEEPNKLDTVPFLSFTISDLQPPIIAELRKFSRDEFDIDGIRASASRLKYTSALKRRLGQLFDAPTEDLVKLLIAGLVEGRHTSSVVEQFTPLVKAAYRELIREAVQGRLSSALAETAQPEPPDLPESDPDEVVTTEEEIEGFHIVRAIVRDVVKPSRVVMRDQKSYCGILIDNNNRKPLARLHLNRSVKYLSLFDGDAEEKVRIDSLDDIYTFAARLRDTASFYGDGKVLAATPPNTAPVELVEEPEEVRQSPPEASL